MELIFIIAVPIIAVVVLIILCLTTDWKEIDEQNQQYYVDGYHIYYDRKILRQLNNKKKI
ncbi:hypothetical protein [Bacteroides sp.]|uniref:hypothetical protein n=1 Tax=Bacteroides sp. TaxID=29523 RepID=UPI00260FB9B8|nr:hypothetical protein [Bacteroides sp.]MDD3039264.1 hypothetical protein [Bacteroides sp.]